MEKRLVSLFLSYTGHEPLSVEPLAGSGSNRKYYRMTGNGISVIGVAGDDIEENKAFCYIASCFRDKGINVPEVYAVSGDCSCYIQEDLGSVNLFDAVSAGRECGEYGESEREILLRTVAMLPKIQLEGAEGFDFGRCYPEPAFCRRMVMSDLNYFKFCFLKTTGLEYNEASLDRDFSVLADDLMSEQADAFMYRDFQSRNVMLKDGEPYFIDFQGGRRGPLQYDLASFVWQAKARYPESLKEDMVSVYLDALGGYIDVDRERFREGLRLYVLFRTLQVLGAYGFRGYFERKEHFLQSIPWAVSNLRELLAEPFRRYPYLNDMLSRLAGMDRFAPKRDIPAVAGGERLMVEVYSFSFRKGIPEDRSGNGGGYVFDCRSIHNPGRYERYRSMTGMDREVIDFLENDGEVFSFMRHVYGVVDPHVETFMKRGFTHLMVSFGCTGGQHRSVYCAESLARHLKEKYDVDVVLTHREQNTVK